MSPKSGGFVESGLIRFFAGRGHIPLGRVRTTILPKIPVLPGNPQDFPGEQAYYEI